jgi:hypothetical protein
MLSPVRVFLGTTFSGSGDLLLPDELANAASATRSHRAQLADCPTAIFRDNSKRALTLN